MKVKANGISINYQVDGPERAPERAPRRRVCGRPNVEVFPATNFISYPYNPKISPLSAQRTRRRLGFQSHAEPSR